MKEDGEKAKNDSGNTPLKKELLEGIHYYINEKGYWVFTETYHLQRGYCCKSGCKHCPYGFSK